MVQAIILIPCSFAVSISSETVMTFSAFMTFFIMDCPAPPKLNFEIPSFSGPFGSIDPKAFCRKLFFLLGGSVTFSLRNADKPPEGEEHHDFVIHRGSAVGDDEGSHHAVVLAAEDNESLFGHDNPSFRWPR